MELMTADLAYPAAAMKSFSSLRGYGWAPPDGVGLVATFK
jgi:hypothetical protein